MSRSIPDVTQEPLMAGDVVRLVPGAGGPSHTATVSRVDGKVIRVRGALDGLVSGARLRLRHVVPEDARYTAEVQVERGGTGLVTLRRTSRWKRVQQRDYVRLRLESEVRCDIEALDTRNKLPFEQAASTQVGRVVDVSAGGVQVETAVPLLPAGRVQITFELVPGQPIEAEGVIVRKAQARRGGHRSGVRFTGISKGAQSGILSFIYARQAARRRTSLV